MGGGGINRFIATHSMVRGWRSTSRSYISADSTINAIHGLFRDRDFLDCIGNINKKLIIYYGTKDF